MDSSIVNHLLEINHQFYQNFAQSFSQTRQRVQPGVRHLLGTYPRHLCLLDIGCGNGDLAKALIEEGFSGTYLGVDFSAPLLEAAPRPNPETNLMVDFRTANLAGDAWEEKLAPSSFDIITAFAVLHHLPGKELRVRVVRQIAALLKSQGIFCHSEWQFMNSPRLAARVLPWETAGLSSTQVDPGDMLLDWRASTAGETGEPGLRYVHLFTEAELAELAKVCGMRIRETFYSDGHEGNLGLYQVWQHV